jgi:opacity protein-like surface antigen
LSATAARAADLPVDQGGEAIAQVAQGYVPEPLPYEQGKGFYATIGLGAQWPQGVSFDTNINGNNYNPSGTIGGGGGGFSGDIGIGYDFGAIRAELTYGYSDGSYGGGGSAWNNPQSLRSSAVGNNGSNSIAKHDVLVSAYWDIATGSRWTPYVGGGIGWSNLSIPQIPTSDGGGKNLFGYQAKLGVSYGVSNSTDLFLEGVYQGTPGYSASNQFGKTDFGSFSSWGGKLGVRFRFGSASAPVAVVEPAPVPRYTPPAPAPAPEPAPQPIRGLW